jgi:hypothetical protein
MASLVLGAVGSAIGPSLFGAGFSFLGVTVTGAEIGGALGTFIGSEIDSALMPGQHINRRGPRISDVNIQASTEGAAVPRLYGRCRAAGQLLWATRFKETVTTKTSGGGKGIGGGPTVTETDYTYSISFAVGLCAGAITSIGRVWADGNLIDLSQFTTRLYTGTETQDADPLIEEIEGAGNTPAYRGLAYIVFEDMPLANFGNRIPQLSFEVVRPVGTLEQMVRAVTFIPGATEFGYEPATVTQVTGPGQSAPENRHIT